MVVIHVIDAAHTMRDTKLVSRVSAGEDVVKVTAGP